MEYIYFEADIEKEIVSSDEKFSLSATEDNFIDDVLEDQPSPSFDRFVNQTRDPADALDNDDDSHLDRRDLQPQMFLAMNREFVEFNDFRELYKCAKNFLKSLVTFQDGDIKGLFFDAILYGLLFKFSEKGEVLREKVNDVLG